MVTRMYTSGPRASALDPSGPTSQLTCSSASFEKQLSTLSLFESRPFRILDCDEEGIEVMNDIYRIPARFRDAVRRSEQANAVSLGHKTKRSGLRWHNSGSSLQNDELLDEFWGKFSEEGSRNCRMSANFLEISGNIR